MIKNLKIIKVNSKYCLVELNKHGDAMIDMKYQALLKSQLYWLNANKNQIISKSKRLYTLYKGGKLPTSFINRCCNFMLLETVCLKYKCYNDNGR